MTATKLSNSKIWSLMTEYYNHMGPDAWKDEIVPHDISTNKYLANIYAELIVSALTDWELKNPQSTDPLYIIEIGAGHGKFGFYVLKLLGKVLKNSPEKLAKLKYIMTDISEKTLASWKIHPALATFVERGLLDFAMYNAFTDISINLEVNKITINKNSLNTPIIAICNYLIDTLPHDAFQIINSKLHEQLIEIKDKSNKISNNNSHNDHNNYASDAENTTCKSKLLKYLDCNFISKPIEANYYDCDNLNKILETYAKHYTNASVLIPVGGIKCIKSLESFSNQYLITLVADKGSVDEDEFEDLEDPEISFHGSVSLMVNFNSLDHFFKNKNGISLLMPNRYIDFQVACFISNRSNQCQHLTSKYYNLLEDFTPQDLFNLCYEDSEDDDESDDVNPGINSIDTAIAVLQLSKWDPGIFCSLNEYIVEFIEKNDDTLFLQQEKILIDGAYKAWDFFFKLEYSQDICFEIGTLFYALEHFEEAIKFYELSLENFGMEPSVLYNLALCHQSLDDEEKAKSLCHKALDINPNYQEVIELVAEFE